MSKNTLVIVAGGFAGAWAPLAAARELHRRDAEHKTEVTLVSPSPAFGCASPLLRGLPVVMEQERTLRPS